MDRTEQDFKSTPIEMDALDQSVALNHIAMELLKEKRSEATWIRLILILSILVNVALAAMFLGYEKHIQTVTTTTTVSQDTGEGTGNNIYQSGENATYTEGVEP